MLVGVAKQVGEDVSWARVKTVVTEVDKEVVGVKRDALAVKQQVRGETREANDSRKEQKERMLGMEEVLEKEKFKEGDQKRQ